MAARPDSTEPPDLPASALDCVLAMKALADPTRLRLVDALLGGPCNVTDLARTCEITAYNASRHLAVLHRAGLLSCRKDAQQRIYRLADACEVLVDKRRRTLDLGCCQFRFDRLEA